MNAAFCTCTRCGIDKPALAFGPGNRGRRRRVCNACMTKAKRQREIERKADPEQNKDLIVGALNAELRAWKGWVSKRPLVSRV